MDMSIPHTMPGSPTSNTASPSSVDSPTLPRTPETPSSALQPMGLPDAAVIQASNAAAAASGQQSAGANAAAAAAAKRKPSRRANTAERRATHNAVERQRRETLNSRFLDLAGLLPNLSQIRRPSKSAIVNSSIAHVHASRRHRMLAARELRLLKMESDALRREINQWRDRAGVPCMDEPVRSDAFGIVLAGELELEQDLLLMEQAGFGAGGDDDMYDDDGDGEYFAAPMAQQQQQQQQAPMAGVPMMANGMMVSPGSTVDEHAALLKHVQAAQAAGNPFAHNLPGNGPRGPALHIRAPQHPAQQHQQHGHGGMLASPLHGGFGAAELGAYDSHRLHPYGHPSHAAPHAAHFVHSPTGMLDETKWAMHQQQMAASGMFTPPSTAHSERGYALLQQRLLQQQQQQQQQQQAHAQAAAGHMFGSPVDGDDGASVGSAPGSAHGNLGVRMPARRRSGSGASIGGRSSVSGSFDPAGEFGAMRMRDRGLSVSTGMGGVGSWNGEQGLVGSPMQGMAMPGGMKTSPIQIPGGGVGMGVGAAFAMML